MAILTIRTEGCQFDSLARDKGYTGPLPRLELSPLARRRLLAHWTRRRTTTTTKVQST